MSAHMFIHMSTHRYVVLLVPRQRTFLSELGPHTLYPYLFHEFFNFGRDRLVMALHLPISTSAFVHLLFYATSRALFFFYDISKSTPRRRMPTAVGRSRKAAAKAFIVAPNLSIVALR